MRVVFKQWKHKNRNSTQVMEEHNNISATHKKGKENKAKKSGQKTLKITNKSNVKQFEFSHVHHKKTNVQPCSLRDHASAYSHTRVNTWWFNLATYYLCFPVSQFSPSRLSGPCEITYDARIQRAGHNREEAESPQATGKLDTQGVYS